MSDERIPRDDEPITFLPERLSDRKLGFILGPDSAGTPRFELGSDLGPFTAENRTRTDKATQSQPKRVNKLANRFLVRDQLLHVLFQQITDEFRSV